MVFRAFTTAKPIRWVKETLPPRPRRRWLLITMRLSTMSLAGMARTLVAVGMDSDMSMLTAVRAAAPRSLTSSAPLGTWTAGCFGFPAAGCAGFGLSSAAGGAEGAERAGAVAVPFAASLAGVRPGP